MKRITILTVLLLFYSQSFFCQDTESPVRPITLEEFLSEVSTGNLGYITEQLNVSISEAELRAAKVFPDPEIGVAYSDNEEKAMQMGRSVEAGLSYPVSLGNKRSAGIALARSQHELSILLLDEYLVNLRANAALSYFAALRDLKIWHLQQDIYEQMLQLARADSIRLSAGEATEMDALQSSLEARSQLMEVLQSLSQMKNAAVNLGLLQGRINRDTLDYPSDEFPVPGSGFNLIELINSALENRIELKIAIMNSEVSEKNLGLIRAGLSPEVNIETGFAHNTIVRNEIAPAPAHNSITAGLSFPLKFSSLNRGAMKSARLTVQKSQAAIEEAELQIAAELTIEYNNFISQHRRLEQYNRSLIDDAGRILKGRIYSYRNGESDLLDVLNAQRTYNELQIDYIQALYDYSAALVTLQRAAGIPVMTK